MKIWKRSFILILAVLLLTGMLPQIPANAKGSVSCKSLCSAALKEAEGAEHLKYQSANAYDFGALSVSAKKKVENISYVCDAKEVYSLCVMQAENVSGAKSLKQQLEKYIKNNKKSSYLSDYSSEEQKVFQYAVCGRKGSYVWYIAMSPKKASNTKGQKAIQRMLKK
ncbi:MAG: DUF4358 domain-containing protein [Roseburia sp.]|nr:DUF4358 domain-containing protein [Roseburia sp.]